MAEVIENNHEVLEGLTANDALCATAKEGVAVDLDKEILEGLISEGLTANDALCEAAKQGVAVDLEKFKEDGYLVIDDFLTDEEVESLRTECIRLVDSMNPNEHRMVFETGANQNLKDDYFIKSADKISYFFEKDAFNADGKLKVDKKLSLNKIGHALHILSLPFKQISHSQKVQDVVNRLGFLDPVIVQSMYIFKQPQIGGKVVPHQDGSYLYVDPMDGLVGLWIALEDATVENGCLSFIPGSHKDGLGGDYRMVRTNEDGEVKLNYEGAAVEYDGKKFVECPVKKGSLVVIHGLVVHKSENNTSDHSRHIYTFHVYDSASSKWNEKNWLQPTSQNTFSPIFAPLDLSI